MGTCDLERIERLVKQVSVLPAVCVERGVAYTESYKNTEGEHPLIRQAMALSHYLRTMTINIGEDETLVGSPTSKARGGALLPEINIKWIQNELDSLSERNRDKFQPISEEERKIILDMIPYWEGKSISDKWQAMVPEKYKELMMETGFIGGAAYSVNSFYPAHVSIDWEETLKTGIPGVRNKIDAQMRKIEMPAFEEMDRYILYRAIYIALDGLCDYMERYAVLAEEKAEKCCDAERKEELIEIANICRKLQKHAPETFHEAVQLMVFIWVALLAEGWGHSVMLGRTDQVLIDFYRNDIRKGISTDADIIQLIAMLYIKVNTSVSIDDFGATQFFGGFPQVVNVVLGGIDKDGNDAVNELSYLFLEAERIVRLPQEDLTVRISPKTPREFVYKTVEVAKELRGKIKFVGDDVHIEQLVSNGYPEELARDYVITGCNSPAIQGVSLDVPGGMFSIPLMLELALNNGVSRISGKKVGLETGDPRKFTTFEQVWEAFEKQFRYFVDIACVMTNIDRKLFAEYTPVPLQTSMFHGAVERGKDVFNGGTGKYGRQAISMAGAPNTGDAFAALKKCVFEEKYFSMSTLIDALDHNFEGYEEVQYRLDKVAKFGNDDDDVDMMVDKVLILANELVSSHIGYCGTPMNIAAATVTSNIPIGLGLGATPDGRKAGEPVADGGLSPAHGKNVSGPTATMQSVAKLTHTSYTNGCVLNMRFNPASLKDEECMWKFADMLKTYFVNNGPFVQFNIVDVETLRAAQKNPEQYKDLLVRIATYTSYFVEVSPDIQNDIIKRIEFDF